MNACTFTCLRCIPLLALAAPLHAQSPKSPISTDRPGLLYSPALVPVGTFQLEASLPGFVRDESGKDHATLLGTPVQLRYGLSEEFELRLLTSPFNFLDAQVGGNDVDESGFGDIELGGKYAVRDGSTGGPPVSATLGVRMPTGDDPFTTGRAAYSLNVAAGFDVAEQTGMTALAGLTRTPSGSESAWIGTLGALLGRSFNDHWSGYGELVHYAGIDNAVDQSFAGTGLVWRVNDDLQLDLGFDFGLNDAAPDVQGAFGLSWRL